MNRQIFQFKRFDLTRNRRLKLLELGIHELLGVIMLEFQLLDLTAQLAIPNRVLIGPLLEHNEVQAHRTQFLLLIAPPELKLLSESLDLSLTEDDSPEPVVKPRILLF